MSPQNTPKPDVPAEIRAEMGRRGWTRQELAKRSGLTEAAVYRLLSGKGPLTLPKLVAIAAAFDLPPSELVARAEDVAA